MKCLSLVVFCDQLEGVARLCGDEALEADEGGTTGSGHLKVGAVVVRPTQSHLETQKFETSECRALSVRCLQQGTDWHSIVSLLPSFVD